MAEMTNDSHLPRIAPLEERSALHGDCVRKAIYQLLAATSNPSFQENIHLLLSSHNLLVLPTPLPLLIFEGKDTFGPVTFECLENTEVREDGSVNITHFWKLKSVAGGIRVHDTIKFNEPLGKDGIISHRNIEVYAPRTSSCTSFGMKCIMRLKSGRLAMASRGGSYSPTELIWFYFQTRSIQENAAPETHEKCDGAYSESGLGSNSHTLLPDRTVHES